MNAVPVPEEALLRAALQINSGDPDLDALARASIIASVDEDDVVLQSVIAREAGPEQAELDIHFDGSDVLNHSALAKPFGVFVARTAEAVKEISKTAIGKNRRKSRLLVSAVSPGSLRVLLKAPPESGHTHTTMHRNIASSVESDALRAIAVLLAQAGERTASPMSNDAESDAVDATISALPPQARERLRGAIGEIAKSGWSVQGQLRQRGTDLVAITLDASGVRQLGDDLARVNSKVTKGVELVGEVDGTRRYTGTAWFTPEGAQRPFIASVLDSKLLDEVNALNAVAHTKVHATFDRYEVQRTGGSKAPLRMTWTLTGIRRIH